MWGGGKKIGENNKKCAAPQGPICAAPRGSWGQILRPKFSSLGGF